LSLEQVITITRKNLQSVVHYLKNRGIDKQTALKWQIGYLPSIDIILQQVEDKEPLVDIGLILKDYNEQYLKKSPLNQYLTFPMYNQYNELIGISGRPPLDNDTVKQLKLKKYWHSIFDKRKFLFGLNHAIKSIRENRYVIVCEGQFDCIIPSQAGIENIVSTCGTALTEEQVILLSRYTNEIYVVFDNDSAGKRAFGQLEKHQKDGINLHPVFLPDTIDSNGNQIKEDPDSFVRKFGKQQFLAILGRE
jgi:DNA primase